MKQKRYEIYQDSIRKFESNRIWGVKSEINFLKPYMTFEEAEKCCDLLNELSEENEQLKQEIIIYKKAFQQQVQRCTL